MIKIDGTAIPTPSGYQVSVMDISKTERNARGQMIIERVAVKRKLELSWAHLAGADLQQVLRLAGSVFLTVEYPDPEDGAPRSGTFYVEDRSVAAMDYLDGQTRWKDVGLSLVER